MGSGLGLGLRVDFIPSPGDGGQNQLPLVIVEMAPADDLVNGPQAANTQSGFLIHAADVVTGRTDH
jgi:hypothetical protein